MWGLIGGVLWGGQYRGVNEGGAIGMGVVLMGEVG